MLAALPGVVLADSASNPPSEPVWRAAYWNNMNLTGNPVLERSEPAVWYDWATRSPDPAVRSDGFSARWQRYLSVEAGTYRFTLRSDDGVRLWIDGALVIDAWTDHPATTYTAERTLTGGYHWIELIYYENQGEALVQFTWETPATRLNNWRGEYYLGSQIGSEPRLVRDDFAIDFNWGAGSPAPGVIPADGFAARWTRSLDLPAGWYTFVLTIDDGGRLWVDNQLLIDRWQEQPERTYAAQIYLRGGLVPVRDDYFEKSGPAVARLTWARSEPSSAPEAGIVDVAAAALARGGAPGGGRFENDGYGNTLIWTRNNDRIRPNYNRAHWHPALSARRYEVFVYIPERFNTTSNARYCASRWRYAAAG
jgi:hypothetical protein